jgi:glycosyltransferase involved in cell wall biosynthesis
MRLTISICTWNRAELLRQTLEQMTRVRVPSEVGLEVLVVNNNSTDATDDVIESFSNRLPVLRLFEAEPGLSHARNRALRSASGDYILWTDDDVLADEGWLEAYHQAFLRYPAAAIFGGPVEPWFAAPPPAWLLRALDQFSAALALRDLGPTAVQLTRWREPFGANMAFRTAALAQYVFDPALGVSALRPISSLAGEETAVIHAMLDAGATGWWVPDARVRHHVAPERMTTTYFRRKAISWGKYKGRLRLAEDGVRRRVPPLWFWRRVVAAEMRYRFHRLFSEPEVWARELTRSGQYWGELLASLSLPPAFERRLTG